MSIQTDSTPLEAPKDWKSCNCFTIYKLIANEEQIHTMKGNYEKGGYGYGHAKQELFDLLIDKYAEERARYHYYMENLGEIDKALAVGAGKARLIANDVLKRVREKVGY